MKIIKKRKCILCRSFLNYLKGFRLCPEQHGERKDQKGLKGCWNFHPEDFFIADGKKCSKTLMWESSFLKNCTKLSLGLPVLSQLPGIGTFHTYTVKHHLQASKVWCLSVIFISSDHTSCIFCTPLEGGHQTYSASSLFWVHLHYTQHPQPCITLRRCRLAMYCSPEYAQVH